MKKCLFILTGILFFFSNCSKQDNLISNTNDGEGSSLVLKSTNSFKGVNWADARDNYNSGWVLPSGILSGDSYSTVKSHAQTICSNFQSKLGANTVRIPINPPTVSQWWSNYKGTIDGALAVGMKVIIACWTESGSVGTVTNTTNFYDMWQTVINSYASNGSVYFEILNEPFGYSTSSWLSLCSTWLSKYSSVSRGRVLVGGTGYDDNVNNVGGDSRVSGCLFSQHIYPWWASYTTNGQWYTNLSNRCNNYSGSTIVTEFGCVMNSGLKFYGVGSTDNNVCFMQGVTNYMRDKAMGSCYWPGLRDGDSYSMTTRNSDYSLNVVNSDAVKQLKWGWGN